MAAWLRTPGLALDSRLGRDLLAFSRQNVCFVVFRKCGLRRKTSQERKSSEDREAKRNRTDCQTKDGEGCPSLGDRHILHSDLWRYEIADNGGVTCGVSIPCVMADE